MTPVEFRGDLWHQKTRVPGLSCGVVCVILRLAVLVELRLVTDRRTRTDTDTHRPMASTADAYHRAVKTKKEKFSGLGENCQRNVTDLAGSMVTSSRPPGRLEKRPDDRTSNAV